MEIETKVISISMESIKPSSPIPESLQKYFLSSLDQSASSMPIPMLYLFASNPKIPNSHNSNLLKKSLSQTLSIFYPLAGTLVGNHYVDCNGGGAPFFEAEANCHLIQIIPNRTTNLKLLDKFIPYNNNINNKVDYSCCLSVQTTYFLCGGVAIGILISHKIADAFSVLMFANAWAAATVNGHVSSTPAFDAAAYFPPKEEIHPVGSICEEEDIVAKTFTFPAAAISLLQERYSGGGGGGHRPSRVEAVSAFIWIHYVSTTGNKSDPSKIYLVSHAVNVRKRVNPSLSENHFGNIVGVSTVMPAAEDGGVEVVRKIREGVAGVNGGLVDKNDEFVLNEMMVPIGVSSLCRFPLYEADFGWGRPVWVGLAQMPYKDVVFLTDTESGGGIEASIHLSNQDMLNFEATFDFELPH